MAGAPLCAVAWSVTGAETAGEAEVVEPDAPVAWGGICSVEPAVSCESDEIPLAAASWETDRPSAAATDESDSPGAMT